MALLRRWLYTPIIIWQGDWIPRDGRSNPQKSKVFFVSMSCLQQQFVRFYFAMCFGILYLMFKRNEVPRWNRRVRLQQKRHRTDPGIHHIWDEHSLRLLFFDSCCWPDAFAPLCLQFQKLWNTLQRPKSHLRYMKPCWYNGIKLSTLPKCISAMHSFWNYPPAMGQFLGDVGTWKNVFLF